MVWKSLQSSSVAYTFTDNASAGTINFYEAGEASYVDGTNVEAANGGAYTFRIEAPVGTQFRVTALALAMDNPNPTPETPSTDYIVATPSVEWSDDRYDIFSEVCESEPFLSYADQPWPSEYLSVTDWLPADHTILATLGDPNLPPDPEDPTVYPAYIGFWNLGRNYNDAYAESGLPTDFSFRIEVWEEGGGGPETDCFWTDFRRATEDCDSAPPVGEDVTLSFYMRVNIGGVYFTQSTEWCEPALTLLTDALSGGTVRITRVWSMTGDTVSEFNFCDDVVNTGTLGTPRTDIALAGGGPLDLDAGTLTWSVSNEVMASGVFSLELNLVELQVDGTTFVYGLCDRRVVS